MSDANDTSDTHVDVDALSRLRDTEVTMPDGTTKRFGDLAPGAALVVNVASKCGFTPQYEGLEALHREFGPQGLMVVGFPCNQFLMQEPGTDAEIAEFCQVNYGVTFSLLAKGKVKGRKADELYKVLTLAPDASGEAGKVQWNFEKFVVSAGDGNGSAKGDGSGATPGIMRFRSKVTPEDPALREAIEAALAAE